MYCVVAKRLDIKQYNLLHVFPLARRHKRAQNSMLKWSVIEVEQLHLTTFSECECLFHESERKAKAGKVRSEIVST